MAIVTSLAPPTRRNVELLLLLIAIAIGLGAYALVGLAHDGRLPGDLLAYGGGMAVLALAVHLVLRWRAAYADPVLLPIVTALNGLGTGADPPARPGRARGAVAGSLALKQLLWTRSAWPRRSPSCCCCATTGCWPLHLHRDGRRDRAAAAAAGARAWATR